jgi:hypothetical protein
MLYIISRQNHPNLSYQGGQEPIVHLEADFHTAVDWADAQGVRWAFTLSNAGSRYFEDRCDRGQLDQINWKAVAANWWQGELEDGKQAEFLLERFFPWRLIERIGVYSKGVGQQVANSMRSAAHRPAVEIRRDWYY